MSAEKMQLRQVVRFRDSAKPKKQDKQDNQLFTRDDFVTALREASRKISPETKK
jgi:hypothetical protein